MVRRRETEKETHAKKTSQMTAANGALGNDGAVMMKGTRSGKSGHMLRNCARFSCLATYVSPIT